MSASPSRGVRIVLTAPLTEAIDYAGFFIQMAMASLPMSFEGVLNRKYPEWREIERNGDGSAKSMPAGIRLLEAALVRRYPASDIVACYPNDLARFIGPDTRVVAVSTHNPIGVTFAAGVYASIFGVASQPINSHYAKAMFETIQCNPYRTSLKVIVGGSGAWQIVQADAWSTLGVDCVVEGRSESADLFDLFDRALAGADLPRQVVLAHPHERKDIIVPAKRTTFGVVEMTTGCGRRCKFCVPDLNPQIDLPADKILAAVHMNAHQGNPQVSLATEDMFIWGQVGTGTPFYFPNREALLDLYEQVVSVPGVEQHVLSHATIAPAVIDPVLIERLSGLLLEKSPLHLKRLSSHPKGKALVPLIGLETGSTQLARRIMPSKAVPFSIDDWPSVVVQGLTVLNRHNWFPAMTLIIGSPAETDDDVKETIDLISEVERRGLFAFFIPSIFTPLNHTQLANARGVDHTRELSPLQWQLLMKCWKMNLRPGLSAWWGPAAWRLGALILWMLRLRKLNGPNFTWPLLMFAGVLPETWLAKSGKLYRPRPLRIKSRRELLATIRPNHRQFVRRDTGDIPEEWPILGDDQLAEASVRKSRYIPLTSH